MPAKKVIKKVAPKIEKEEIKEVKVEVKKPNIKEAIFERLDVLYTNIANKEDRQLASKQEIKAIINSVL